MRASRRQLEAYLTDLAGHLWSLGADLTEPELLEAGDDVVGFELAGELPGAGVPKPGVIILRERWRTVGDELERIEYGYELIDHPRERRRAYHLHDVEAYRAAYDVLVHEHCEEPMGTIVCHHYYGEPVTDGYAAFRLLYLAWSDESMGCDELRCLGDRGQRMVRCMAWRRRQST